MKTGEYDGAAFEKARSHPWTEAASNAAFRYYDLKKEPTLIRSAMEDLIPWRKYAAIERFYLLLESLNAPGSPFESNDCAFSGPGPSEPPDPVKKFQCTGRVMILFSDLARNLSPKDIAALKGTLHRELMSIDVEFEHGMIGTTLIPVDFLELPREERRGQELMVSFWVWGDTEPDVMTSLDRLLRNLTEALVKVAARA